MDISSENTCNFQVYHREHSYDVVNDYLNQLNIRIDYARRYSLGSEESPYVHSKHVSRKLHIHIYLPHLS